MEGYPSNNYNQEPLSRPPRGDLQSISASIHALPLAQNRSGISLFDEIGPELSTVLSSEKLTAQSVEKFRAHYAEEQMKIYEQAATGKSPRKKPRIEKSDESAPNSQMSVDVVVQSTPSQSIPQVPGQPPAKKAKRIWTARDKATLRKALSKYGEDYGMIAHVLKRHEPQDIHSYVKNTNDQERLIELRQIIEKHTALKEANPSALDSISVAVTKEEISAMTAKKKKKQLPPKSIPSEQKPPSLPKEKIVRPAGKQIVERLSPPSEFSNAVELLTKRVNFILGKNKAGVFHLRQPLSWGGEVVHKKEMVKTPVVKQEHGTVVGAVTNAVNVLEASREAQDANAPEPLVSIQQEKTSISTTAPPLSVPVRPRSSLPHSISMPASLNSSGGSKSIASVELPTFLKEKSKGKEEMEYDEEEEELGWGQVIIK